MQKLVSARQFLPCPFTTLSIPVIPSLLSRHRMQGQHMNILQTHKSSPPGYEAGFIRRSSATAKATPRPIRRNMVTSINVLFGINGFIVLSRQRRIRNWSAVMINIPSPFSVRAWRQKARPYPIPKLVKYEWRSTLCSKGIIRCGTTSGTLPTVSGTTTATPPRRPSGREAGKNGICDD